VAKSGVRARSTALVPNLQKSYGHSHLTKPCCVVPNGRSVRRANPEGVAFTIFATLIGALQLARAVEGTELSDRILAAGADAAKALIRQVQDEVAV